MFPLNGAASAPPSRGEARYVAADSGGGDGVGTLEDAHKTATHAAGWFADHWSQWLAEGLRILLILAIAIVLRHLIRRSITRLIERMNRRAEAEDSANALRGLLVSGERRRQRSAAIGSLLRSVSSVVILGTAVLTVLSGLGINLAPLLASAGVAGVALGFGARDLVTDWLAGMFMLLEDQYGVGDRVDVGEVSGTVLEVGLRITQLRGDGGEIWYIRNGEIKRVGNLSQGWATAALDVQLRPGEDLERVRAAIDEAGQELARTEPWDEVLWEPVKVLGLDAVTLDSVVVRVSARTMPGKSLDVERELRWRIKRALDRQGIDAVAQPLPGPEQAGPSGAADADGGRGGDGRDAGRAAGAPEGQAAREAGRPGQDPGRPERDARPAPGGASGQDAPPARPDTGPAAPAGQRPGAVPMQKGPEQRRE